MLTNKKKLSATLAALSLFALVGCDTDEMKYPSNYTDKVVDTITDNNKNVPTAQDTLKQYYQSLTNDDAVYEKTVKKTLTLLADNVLNIDDSSKSETAVYHAIKDDLKTSVADSYGDSYRLSSDKNENLLAKARDSMLSSAKGGSYEDDKLWDEKKYAKYLTQNYYYLKGDNALSEDGLKKMLVTPEMKYDDVFSSVNEKGYADYQSTELYDDMKVNYLTAEYIYKKSYASIGNSNARKVQVVSIADRSDEPGAARKLLDAYVRDYIQGTDESLRDPDFSILSKLWKGITVDSLLSLLSIDATLTTADDGYTITFRDTSEEAFDKELLSRYGITVGTDGKVTIAEKSAVLTKDQAKWLEDNNIVTSSSESDTLLGSILHDKKKIDDGLQNWHKIDSSLESTYTGSYAHSLEQGYMNAVDDLVKRNLVTEGTYLKSTGISSLPSGLTDRIFSPKVSTKKSDIDSMKDKPGSKVDLTTYENDGFRYMTVADTLSSDTNNILFYDASSKTYYITRMLDVVDTYALATSSGADSIYDTPEKKEQMAREVSYVMSTTGSYKTDSAVYWFSRMDFTYSDEAFLAYMKSNYNDVFKTENPYSSESKIDLSKFPA